MSTERSSWSSRIGFILASVGAAVGLGAIWKFPYLVGSNGGSVFLFPYVLLSFTVGLVLLIAEVALGRTGKGSIVTAYRAIGGRAWVGWGYLGVLTGFCVLCFYSAIGGWTISYFIDAVLGNGIVADQNALNAHFGALVSNPYISIGYQALFLFVTAWIVAYDVSKGIERIGKTLMPLLFVLVLVVIVRGLTLPGAEKGIAYLFSWNPSAFSFQSLLAAMGFTFFSLCVGCGCMLTYGSYLPKSSNLVSGCAWITFLATFSSILGGLMIMPAVFAFDLNPAAGPGLTFMTMPVVFAQLPMGQLFAVAFYLCLVVAAVTSAVSMLELVVAFFVDELNMRRVTAVTLVTIVMLVVGSFCGLSFGPLA
ncbi:MAG: sodium-dependent transporter, partial [Duodenibacillus sp.]